MAAPEHWRKVHKLADRWVPAFARAVEAQRESIVTRWRALGPEPSLAEIDSFLASLKANPPGIDIKKELAVTDLTDAYADVISTGARLALVAEPSAESRSLAESMTVTNPYAVEIAQRETVALVTGVNKSTIDAIRRVITTATREGAAPRVQARLIETVIGLDEPRAVAVQNFERQLLERAASGQSGSALGRARALAPRVPTKVNPASVERLVESYARRMLRDRALTIARTETMRAANRGVRLAGESLARLPDITTADIAFVWIVTPDDRLCPRCAPMHDQVVGFGSPFKEVGGANVTTQTPPLHAKCRCAIARKVEPI